jgi:hypothetical protein
MTANWQSVAVVALALPLLGVTLAQVLTGATLPLALAEVLIGALAVGLAWWGVESQRRRLS